MKIFKNKKVKFLLKAGVSALLLFIVVIQVDWTNAWSYVTQMNVAFLFLYIALLFVGIAISTKKWMVLTRYKGFAYSYGWHMQRYLAGMFVNNFFPSTIGGDTYRALSLGVCPQGKRSPGVSTIFFDRLTGLWALAFLGCVFAIFEYELVLANPFWMLVFVVMAGFLLFDVVLTLDRREYLARFIGWFSTPAGNLTREMASFRSPEVVRLAFFWSLAFSFVGVGVSNWVLFHAFGVPVEFIQFLSVIFAISIVSAIPISVNNIGVKEWAYFTFFGFLGLSTDVAVVVAIVSRFIQMFISFLAIPGYIRGKKQEEHSSS